MPNPMHGYWAGLYPGTPSERALEPAVAALAIPYRTQFPYFLWGVRYFPDFLLPTIGVIIEVDDDTHNDPEKQKADAQRTSAFEKLGWVVVRCTNDEAEYQPEETINRLVVRSGLLDRQGPGLPAIPDYAKKRKQKKPGHAKKASAPASAKQAGTRKRNSSTLPGTPSTGTQSAALH